MIGEKSEQVRRFWQECTIQHGITESFYHASTFADPKFAEYQGELIDLAIEGKKQATAHLLLDFERNGVPRREVGDYWVVVTPESQPKCLVRITDIDVRSFNAVEATFAVREGEGDGTFEYWSKVHLEYFTRQCEDWCIEWREDLLVVCEGFELVAVA